MYTATPRFWLVFILTICVLCAVGCGGSNEPLPPEMCDTRPTPQTVGPYPPIPCSSVQ